MEYDQSGPQIRRASVGTLVIPGYVALWLAKLADIITTLVGLELIPAIVELNPFARLYMAHVGVAPGLLIQGGLVVIVVPLFLEYLFHKLYHRIDALGLIFLLRSGAYGSLTLLYGLTAIRNTQLIIAEFSPQLLFGL